MTVRQPRLSSLLDRSGNQGLESLSCVPNVTESVSSRTVTRTECFYHCTVQYSVDSLQKQEESLFIQDKNVLHFRGKKRWETKVLSRGKRRLKIGRVEQIVTKASLRTGIRDRRLSKMLGCVCHEQKVRSRGSCFVDKNGY